MLIDLVSKATEQCWIAVHKYVYICVCVCVCLPLVLKPLNPLNSTPYSLAGLHEMPMVLYKAWVRLRGVSDPSQGPEGELQAVS